MEHHMLQQWFADTGDLQVEHVEHKSGRISICFLTSMADRKMVYEALIPRIRRLAQQKITLTDLERELGLASHYRARDQAEVVRRLLTGGVCIHLQGGSYSLIFPTDGAVRRKPTEPGIESNVLGPQVAFAESLETNLSLIRQYVPTAQLLHERLQVGKTIPTNVSLLYMKGIADEENVHTMRQRIRDLTVDEILDATLLAQYVSDNEKSLFPLLQLSQRPDRAVAGLIQGQVVVLVEGSPFAVIGPTSFVQFFQSPDDFYFNWNIATFVRLMRVVAIILSLLLTPAYVASLTYHYELIPADLLISLAQSRSRVAFPPLWEALLLEGIIELLREAGARLPTKVGQTIGIVGGIVIGQAAVQAGFTSNILIIIVALGALASFIAPSYMLGATIRVVRFPMILLAGMWGGVGIAIGFSFLISHLLRQKSLGRPYLSPAYPLRLADLKDSVVRLPLSLFSLRPVFLRSEDKQRFDGREAVQEKDIDE